MIPLGDHGDLDCGTGVAVGVDEVTRDDRRLIRFLEGFIGGLLGGGTEGIAPGVVCHLLDPWSTDGFRVGTLVPSVR